MSAPFYGLIHDEVDLKLLILYILRRLPGPVDRETLFEICICDNGVEYFDFAEYLEELKQNGQICVNEDDEYTVTEQGAKNGEEVECSLPKSVRLAADKAAAGAAEHIRRMNLIKAEPEETDEGLFMHLSLSDGEIDLLDMKIYCGDPAAARAVRKNFRREAEKFYSKFITLLTEEKRRKV